MLKNNGKMIIGRNFLFCLCVICLMFTAFGFAVESSFAADFNDTVDEVSLEIDNPEKLENSQENQIKEVDTQDQLSATFTPSTNTYKSIQEKVNAAKSGDTILLSGTYYSSGNDCIKIDKKLTIKADSSATLDGKGLSNAFRVTEGGAGTVFKNLKFINGHSTAGSAIYVAAKNVQIEKCIFEKNHADRGGAVMTKDDLQTASGLIVDNCQFLSNTAYIEGSANFSAAAGLGAYGIDSEVRNCVFENNLVKGSRLSVGGAIQIGLDEPGSNGKVINCIFKNNGALCTGEPSHGGAGCLRSGTVYENCIFMGNYADEGGALTFHGTGDLKNCTFINNTAFHFGGALSTGFLYDYMVMTVSDCNFEGNTAPIGGAIQANGLNVIIKDCNFRKNEVTENGGAINVKAQDVTIKDCIFNSNIANVNGGGIYIEGTNTLVQGSSFVSNEARPDVKKLDDGLGGAIYINSSQAHIKDNSFRFNTARNGSAIYYSNSGERLTLENNEMFQNQAWVYHLPISAKDIYYGDSEEIKVVLFGGNNIAKYNNLAASNAIYNDAEYYKLVMDNEYPLNGATNSGELYQDSREYNINVMIKVQHEDGTVVYDNSRYTSYLGEISLNLDNLKPGKYYVSAKHFEDTYYKAITNETTFLVNPKVDLEVKKSVSRDVANLKDTLTWALTVINHGPNDASNVRLTDVLPKGLVYISDTSGGRYDHNGGVLKLDELKSDKTFSFNIVTSCDITGEIVNKVNVTSDEMDTNTTNNHAEKSVFINPASDLSVIKTVSNSKPNYNDHIVWTVEIANNGPDDAHDVRVYDLLAESLIYEGCDVDYDVKSGIATIGLLKSGEKVKINIRCIVNDTGSIKNSVFVNATEYDYDMSNNNDTEGIHVPSSCDLAVEKSVSSDTVNLRDIMTWTITVKNNGPDDAVNVVVSDVLPKGLIYVSDDSNGRYNRGSGILRLDELRSDKSFSFNIVARANVTGKMVNKVNVTSDDYDVDLTNNYAEKSVFVNPASDLSVKKTVSNDRPNLNDHIVWTVEIANNGPDDAHDVRVYDLLAESLVYEGCDVDYDVKSGIATIGLLKSGEKVKINIRCIVNATGSIKNSVFVNSSEYDFDMSNNNDSEVINVNPACDLAIIKGVSVDVANIEDVLTWTITLINNGPDDAVNVVVSDVLPKGLIYVSDDSNGRFDPNSGVLRLDELKSDKTFTFNIATVVSGTGEILNEANVTSDVLDVNTSNNYAEKSVFINPASDLAVDKIVSNDKPNYNDHIVWTIIITNNGPDDAHDIRVYDLLAESLVYEGCDVDYDEKSGIASIDLLKSGAKAEINIRCYVNGTGLIENNVLVNATEYDYDLTNNNDTEHIYVAPACDLSISKTANASDVNLNDVVKWTLEITNNGPDNARDVEVVDLLPDGFVYLSSTQTKGTYSNDIFSIDAIGVGEKIIIEIITSVAETGNAINHASVSSDDYDYDLTNNDDNESVFVNPAADIVVTKSVSESNPKFGDVVTWTIEVLNRGPDVAHNITVSDLLAKTLVWKDDDSSGDYNHLTGILSIDELDVGESYLLNIDCIVRGTGLIENNVSVNAAEYDFNLTNNFDNETVDVEKSADVSIIKFVDNNNPNYHDLVKWTLIISNMGPDKANNIWVEEALPEGLILVNYTATKGIYDRDRWVMCCLNSSEVQTLELVCKVNKTGQIINFATIHADEFDPDESNNHDNESIYVPPVIDLQISLNVNNSNPVLGEAVRWMIIVTNNGPDNATGVIVEDILPEELLFESDKLAKRGLSNVWNIGSLNVGDKAYINVTTLPNALGIISNDAKVNANELDWNMSNNYDEDIINVNPVADLVITKSVDNEFPKYGDIVKWTITLLNKGPNIANNVVVRDILPEGLKFIDSSGDYSKGVWKVASIDVGEEKTLEITCSVDSTGNFVNVVSVSGDEFDPDESNNRDNQSIDVTPACDLSITKIASKYKYHVDDIIEYEIEVVNNGPDTAYNIEVSEILDDLMNIKSFKVTGGKFTKSTCVWKIDSLDFGESEKLTIKVVAKGSGTLKNTVNVTTDTFDYDLSNNDDYAVVKVSEDHSHDISDSHNSDDNKKPSGDVGKHRNNDSYGNSDKKSLKNHQMNSKTNADGNSDKNSLKNLQMHSTANPIGALIISLIFSAIFIRANKSNKR